MAEHAADEHGRRSDHIITAVLRRGAQGGRADGVGSVRRRTAPSTASQEWKRRGRQSSERKRHRLGVQDLFEGRARQLRADEQNQHRDEQAGKILHARMAERMLLIRQAAPARRKPSSVTSEEAASERLFRPSAVMDTAPDSVPASSLPADSSTLHTMPTIPASFRSGRARRDPPCSGSP